MGHIFPLIVWNSLLQPHPPASLTLLCCFFFPISSSSSRSPSYSSKSCKKSPGSRSSRPRRSPSYSCYSRSRYSCLLLCYLLSTHVLFTVHSGGTCCLMLSPCLHHCDCCEWWAEPEYSAGSAHTAGLQPLSERDLTAAGKDTLLFRVTALTKDLSGPGQCPCCEGRCLRPALTALQRESSPGNSTPSIHHRKQSHSSTLDMPLAGFPGSTCAAVNILHPQNRTFPGSILAGFDNPCAGEENSSCTQGSGRPLTCNVLLCRWH